MTIIPDEKARTDATGSVPEGGRSPYERPLVTRVDLALEETMSKGCKQESDFGCMVEDSTMFDAGS